MRTVVTCSFNVSHWCCVTVLYTQLIIFDVFFSIMTVLQLRPEVYLFRKELGKGINTDEAAALGAVYQAAHLGKGFKVKKFGIKDATIYPIKVRVPAHQISVVSVVISMLASC